MAGFGGPGSPPVGGCSRREILAELARRGLIEGNAKPGRRYPAQRRSPTVLAERDQTDRIALARRFWDTAQASGGTPVAAYLANRGLILEPPPTLRRAPSLRRLDGTYGPAMVGLVEHVERGVVALHRTWLHPDANGTWTTWCCRSGEQRLGAPRGAPCAHRGLLGGFTFSCAAEADLPASAC